MLYFAYGSNLNWSQMKQRCPSARFVCIATLKDYRFAISRKSRFRGCGTADVVPQEGSQVWGVVYEIEEIDLPELDRLEDGYRRERLWINPSSDGKVPLEVTLYIAEKQESPPPPSSEYKRIIVEGAKRWKLPAEYIQMLERMETQG